MEDDTSKVRRGSKSCGVEVPCTAESCRTEVYGSRKLKLNEREHLVWKPHSPKIKILLSELGVNRGLERIQLLHAREMQYAIAPTFMLLIERLSRTCRTHQFLTVANKIGFGLGCG